MFTLMFILLFRIHSYLLMSVTMFNRCNGVKQTVGESIGLKVLEKQNGIMNKNIKKCNQGNFSGFPNNGDSILQYNSK